MGAVVSVGKMGRSCKPVKHVWGCSRAGEETHQAHQMEKEPLRVVHDTTVGLKHWH